ncbi:MAG: DUF5063 domain-containing protein [Bdellovibrio sp.]|nr:DUF5063 domain-containing protein [Bdellovibrio sp.]
MENSDVSKITQIINEFIEFIEQEWRDKINRNKKLLMLLDSLALAQADIKYKFDEMDYPDPPKNHFSEVMKLVRQKFNDFGNYNWPAEIEENLSKTDIIVGDAIDDILDIYREMKEIQWRLKNTSANDALWCFENHYNIHWGTHLRNLQRYVHYKEFRI